VKKLIAPGVAAGFGGIAPNLFRLSTDMMGGTELPGLSYLLGMLMFAIIGGGTALALGETEAKKAFFLGLGLPAMFQATAQDASSHVASFELFPSAYAMEEEPQRPVLVRWKSEAEPKAFSLIYRGEDVKRRLKDDYDPALESEGVAPMWATGAQAVLGDVKTGPRSDWLDFEPGDSELDFVVTVTPLPWSGLKKAVGLDAMRFSISLSFQKEEGGS